MNQTHQHIDKTSITIQQPTRYTKRSSSKKEKTASRSPTGFHIASKDVQSFIDEEFTADIEKYRQIYRSSKKDSKSIRRWLLATKHLELHQLAMVMGVALTTVHSLKRKHGFTSNKPMKLKNRHTKQRPNPPQQLTNEWVLDCYANGYSVYMIASVAKCNARKIWSIIKKHSNLPTRSMAEACKSKNECCNIDWIKTHYVDQLMSIRRCAALAKVTRLTFTSWLVSFGIRVRSSDEQLSVNTSTHAISNLGDRTTVEIEEV